jgi:hypothetical protein
MQKLRTHARVMPTLGCTVHTRVFKWQRPTTPKGVLVSYRCTQIHSTHKRYEEKPKCAEINLCASSGGTFQRLHSSLHPETFQVTEQSHGHIREKTSCSKNKRWVPRAGFFNMLCPRPKNPWWPLTSESEVWNPVNFFWNVIDF